jgi:hypothetical protein
MAIVSFFENAISIGAIGTTASASVTHNFPKAAKLDTWSRPTLSKVNVNDDEAGVTVFVSQFVDKAGTHNGPFFPGIVADECTSVTFLMKVSDCIAAGAATTYILG